MQSRSKFVAATCGTALVAGVLAVAYSAGSPATAADVVPDATVNGVAQAAGISADQARTRLLRQEDAHRLLKALPQSLRGQSAGHWFDAGTGKLTLAVTDEKVAKVARAAGADAKVVSRSQAELDRLLTSVRNLVGQGVPGVYSWGVDVQNNKVRVTVNRSAKTTATEGFVAAARALGDGVEIVETKSAPRQQSKAQQNAQAGTVQPGSPWWPGTESNCSIGFSVTDSSGGKHFLTAGHCTNDVNQAAYGQSGQLNKIGTSNVGGGRSVNGREGDMGVVAVTESGWTLSASVNTWGQPAITVTGSAEAMVGDAVCHSGNTSKWKCGTVKYTHKSVDYGGSVGVIEDMTWTDACSLGGDSGGGWLLGDKATGLHDGGPSQCVTNPGDDDMSIFQPVNEALTKWGLTLVTGGGDTTAPTAPGNARSTGTTANTVSLAWDASTDAVGVTGYDVYNGSTLATTVAGTSATVSGLTSDTPYTFTVKAKDAAGNVSAASNAVNARTQPGDPGGDVEPPTTPGNPRSTGVTDTTVSLAWDASVDDTGVTGYDVFNGSALATTVTGTAATVSGLTASTDYSFTIQAKDAAGNKSKPTKPVAVRTGPGGGGGRTFTNGTDYQIRDYQVAISPLTSTATGAATNPVTVKVIATHTCVEDLNVTLVSPSGRWYPLLRTPGGYYDCHPFPANKSFSVVPAADEKAGGTWTLRIGDNGPGDVGVLDSWSVTV
jgi:streptogrisin C